MSFESSHEKCVINRLFSVSATSVSTPSASVSLQGQATPALLFFPGGDYGLFISTFPWRNTKMKIRGMQIALEEGNFSGFSVSKRVTVAQLQGHRVLPRSLL